jgi:hypothetical protein
MTETYEQLRDSATGEAGAADHDMRERTEQVLDAIARGAAEKMWSTRWELDYSLRWDHSRECWMGGDGHRYDGSRFGARNGSPRVARDASW